jgi:hypothetical protein
VLIGAQTVFYSVGNWAYHALIFTWHDPWGYNFVSGPLPSITLVAAALAIIRRHNCHAKGCWRLGMHPVNGTSYIVCKKHHPRASAPTVEQIHAAHAAAHATLPLPPQPAGTSTSET